MVERDAKVGDEAAEENPCRLLNDRHEIYPTPRLVHRHFGLIKETRETKMNALENALVSQDPELAAALEANTWKRNIAMAMRRLRHEAGMSQEDVAAKAGMSQSHVAKTEAPYGGLPTLITLKKYARACGRDVLHLEFLSSDEFASRKNSVDMSSPSPEVLDSEAPRESAPAEGAAIENGGVYLR